MNDISENNSRAVVFANYKGGVAKTTLAVHFAVYVAKKMSLNTLVLDMDDQRSCFGFFDSTEYIREIKPLSEILSTHELGFSVKDKKEGIIDLAYMDETAKTILDNANDIFKTAEYISPLLTPQSYDYIVIDCPAGMNQRNYAGMLIGEYFVLPMGASREDYNGALETIIKLTEITELLDQKEIETPLKDIVGYLPVRVAKGHLQTKIYLDTIKEQIGEYLIDNVMISNRPVIQQCMKDKKTIWNYNLGDPRDAKAEMTKVVETICSRIFALEAAEQEQ